MTDSGTVASASGPSSSRGTRIHLYAATGRRSSSYATLGATKIHPPSLRVSSLSPVVCRMRASYLYT